MFFGNGLLGVDDNEQWRRDRALLKPAFSGRAITSLMPIMRKGNQMVEVILSSLHTPLIPFF
jgi:cytochrome P450